MLAKVKTAAVVGLDAQEVEVEVDMMGGLPAMKRIDLNQFRIAVSIWEAGFEWFWSCWQRNYSEMGILGWQTAIPPLRCHFRRT